MESADEVMQASRSEFEQSLLLQRLPLRPQSRFFVETKLCLDRALPAAASSWGGVAQPCRAAYFCFYLKKKKQDKGRIVCNGLAHAISRLMRNHMAGS